MCRLILHATMTKALQKNYAKMFAKCFKTLSAPRRMA